MKVPEILAPAGGRPQFFAALNAGADAVYLGLQEFNARARATNFTVADLQELVPLAHRYGMKVLVTVNVLIKDIELGRLLDTLSALEDLAVHAIIVQDAAVASLARKYFPELRLHASTQAAVHNLAGVKEAWRMGFRRVVLARELTAHEVKRIRDAVPPEEMEIETFCHGSLCYSYSGLCFFSGAADARSGNRGECAYTCRVPYKITSEPGHGFLFSMRDLDTSQDLGALVSTGIDTLKIEGRKKDAQYVSTVVKLYRNSLDRLFGQSTLRPEAPAEAREKTSEAVLRNDLALSFNRNPTTFFLKGRYFENVIDLDNPTHLGLRVGAIRQVAGGKVTVRTETPIERFDGLKLLSADKVFHAKPQHGEAVKGNVTAAVGKYDNEAPQFSLREMRVDGKWTPTANPGATVEIDWPCDVATPTAGDVLYKVRSADLKRRVLKGEAPPADARLRPLSFVDLAITIEETDQDLVLHGKCRRFGETLTEGTVTFAKVPRRGAGSLADDIAATLGLFGDEGFQTREVTIAGAEGKWFVPRAKLKDLKAQLANELGLKYRVTVADRRLRADEKTVDEKPALGRTQYHVKIDRLEMLEAYAAFLAKHPEFPAGELLFEPKRAFLPGIDSSALAAQLKAFPRPVRLSLPTVIRAWDEAAVKRWLMGAAEAGLRRYEVGNLGALELLKMWGLEGEELASDFTLYAMNREATRVWAERGVKQIALSVEDDAKNLSSHLAHWPWATGAVPVAILHKDTPLFIAEACSLTALHNGCPTAKVCGYRTLEIENPQGEKFYVAHESCKSVVYAKDAYSITHRRGQLEAMGVRDFRIDFVTRPYDAAAMEVVLLAALRGEKQPGTHPANFDRELL